MIRGQRNSTARPETVKILTEKGVRAIRNGIKANANSLIAAERKPDWIRTRAGTGGGKFRAVRDIVHANGLSTVCEEALCPNISECWAAGTATLMLMGSVCTRACKFCAVDTGNPRGWLDPDEPRKTGEAVKLMGLKYVVLTSVDRDDLPDGGAAHYARAVREIKRLNPATAVEVLTPDFGGDTTAVDSLLAVGVEVFAQNIETVERLTRRVRDPRAGYDQTLAVLRYAKKAQPQVLTKSSLMLGLGESDEEIFATMDDLRTAGVDVLTLGQYLRPTLNHLPVERYVTPGEFDHYREIGLSKGFVEVVSGPLVRSSYRAERVLEGVNVGL